MKDDEAPAMQLTEDQAKVIVGLERTGAALSLAGVLLIIFSFAFLKRLRTVPNTFILFASIANIGASTASLIGLSGIAEGSQSTLCRAQAFLLEMFMQSDPWWSFAMAFNVYLVFFHSANPTTFRRHLWAYCLVCFGFPMIPAIVCLYVKNAADGSIYGDATLWCWIGDKWNSLRIFSYYMPIWICIFFSALIYVAVGYHVFHQRNQLRNLSFTIPAKDVSSSENLTGGNSGFYGTVITEVQITSDVCEPAISNRRTPPMTPLASPEQCPWNDGPFPLVTTNNTHLQNGLHNHSFSIDEELGVLPPSPPAIHGADGSDSTYQARSTTITATPPPVPPPVAKRYSRFHLRRQQQQQPEQQCTPAASPYPLQQLPSRSQRSEWHRSRPSNLSFTERARRAFYYFVNKLRHLDPVKLAYLRTSFVFAISVLVTWTPSSINRVYTLIYPTRSDYGLNIASAAVLPLQGVWNAVIYFTTSWALFKDELCRVCYRSRWLRRLYAGTRLDGSGLPGRGQFSGAAAAADIAGVGRALGGRVRAAGSSGVEANGTALAPLGSHQSALLSGPAGPAAVGSGPGTGSSAYGSSAVGQGGQRRPKPIPHTFLDSDDDDDDKRGALVGTLTPSSLRGGRWLQPGASADVELCPRVPAKFGTIRIQKGGQLDT